MCYVCERKVLSMMERVYGQISCMEMGINTKWQQFVSLLNAAGLTIAFKPKTDCQHSVLITMSTLL